MKIKAPYLLIIASIIWLIPAVLISRTGFMTRATSWDYWRIIGAVLTFIPFNFFIFARIVKKHTERIKGYGDTKQSITKTFDLKTYIIIVFMIILGILLRRVFHVHEAFISFFYPGLGLALLIAGIKFLVAFFRK